MPLPTHTFLKIKVQWQKDYSICILNINTILYSYIRFNYKYRADKIKNYCSATLRIYAITNISKFLVSYSANHLPFKWSVLLKLAGPSCRAVEGIGLRPLACWDCGFESHRGAWMFVVSAVCCKVEVSAKDWSLVQGSPTDCGASLCVWSRNLENEEAKARYRAVKIQPLWVVTPRKLTNSWN